MIKFQPGLLALAISSIVFSSTSFAADSISEALKAATVFGDFRLRYEDVDNDVIDSDGLTLRSRIGFKSADYKGFSTLVEVEDVRDVAGIDDEGNLIPDPEVTEIDQAFIQYKGDGYMAKAGRQVITLDGHRFVGDVGWRQDRQTFDAVRSQIDVSEKLKLDISYIFKRNRIFAEDMDAKSSDLLLNAAYQTPIGKIVGYGYLLDDDTRDEKSDTFGASLSGATAGDISFLYHIEAATQSIEDSGVDYDAEYFFAEGGIKFSGITAKLGYEVLGSDDGQASFTTPLATLHKFNGWNDIFLGGSFNPTAMPNGLVDTYISVGTKISGIAVAAVMHEYEAEEGSADYGDEMGFVVSKGFSNGVSTGLKYSSYDADTFSSDTDKLWIWVGAKF
ncbi:alginate export family protein [Oceanicoccus sp. KOV_DT_Chl]|uniref:alginate export family protein n=1 Tax=Oceanicoccus sp. KOV_DT_Chl TaxID=1904639 RepID=UPI000C7C25F6|nr:alginate export family protein [Oceanicoccus sp. KOV_DT_Chl]